MTKKHRARDEEVWAKAKAICRLTARQVEMARALGMNPRKLPGLRPGPQQRWRLPVGEFMRSATGSGSARIPATMIHVGRNWDRERIESSSIYRVAVWIAVIVAGIAAVGFVVNRLRARPSSAKIDVGEVSTNWIVEHRADKPQDR